MPIYKYENLTHQELASLVRDRTVVLFPTGPLEQHGPHLPLGVDAMTATYFSEKLAERLSVGRKDWNFVLFPTMFAGSDTLTYTGTIEVRPAVLRALIYDCCKQLARDGFKTIIGVSAHGGPRHSVVLDEVAAKMRWRHRTRMINASGRILHDILSGGFIEKIEAFMRNQDKPLNDAEKQGLKHDYHGGLLETSIMMVARPELVSPIYKELKPALVESFYKLRRTSGRTVGEGLGHLGSPALARPEIGKAAVEVLLGDIIPLVERFLNGENVNKVFRTKFYYVPFLRTDFKYIAVFAAACFIMTAMLWIVNVYLLEMFR